MSDDEVTDVNSSTLEEEDATADQQQSEVAETEQSVEAAGDGKAEEAGDTSIDEPSGSSVVGGPDDIPPAEVAAESDNEEGAAANTDGDAGGDGNAAVMERTEATTDPGENDGAPIDVTMDHSQDQTGTDEGAATDEQEPTAEPADSPEVQATEADTANEVGPNEESPDPDPEEHSPSSDQGAAAESLQNEEDSAAEVVGEDGTANDVDASLEEAAPSTAEDVMASEGIEEEEGGAQNTESVSEDTSNEETAPEQQDDAEIVPEEATNGDAEVVDGTDVSGIPETATNGDGQGEVVPSVEDGQSENGDTIGEKVVDNTNAGDDGDVASGGEEAAAGDGGENAATNDVVVEGVEEAADDQSVGAEDQNGEEADHLTEPSEVTGEVEDKNATVEESIDGSKGVDDQDEEGSDQQAEAVESTAQAENEHMALETSEHADNENAAESESNSEPYEHVEETPALQQQAQTADEEFQELQYDDDQVAAALCIQRHQRGRRDRARIQQMRAGDNGSLGLGLVGSASKMVDRRHELGNPTMGEPGMYTEAQALEVTQFSREEESAAVKIQSVQRGRKDRARVRALRIEERRQAHAEAIGEYDTLGMDESAAAIKIQSITRGRQARREVAQLRAEHYPRERMPRRMPTPHSSRVTFKSHSDGESSDSEGEPEHPLVGLPSQQVASGRMDHHRGEGNLRVSSLDVGPMNDPVLAALTRKLESVDHHIAQLQAGILRSLDSAATDDSVNLIAEANDRVDRLMRMREQIVVAVNHQNKLNTSKHEPSPSDGGGSGRPQGVTVPPKQAERGSMRRRVVPPAGGGYQGGFQPHRPVPSMEAGVEWGAGMMDPIDQGNMSVSSSVQSSVSHRSSVDGDLSSRERGHARRQRERSVKVPRFAQRQPAENVNIVDSYQQREERDEWRAPKRAALGRGAPSMLRRGEVAVHAAVSGRDVSGRHRAKELAALQRRNVAARQKGTMSLVVQNQVELERRFNRIQGKGAGIEPRRAIHRDKGIFGGQAPSQRPVRGPGVGQRAVGTRPW